MLSVSYSGFVNGDTSASLTAQPVVSTTATTSSPVASYPITASGAVDANYTICYIIWHAPDHARRAHHHGQ